MQLLKMLIIHMQNVLLLLLCQKNIRNSQM